MNETQRSAWEEWLEWWASLSEQEQAAIKAQPGLNGILARSTDEKWETDVTELERQLRD